MNNLVFIKNEEAFTDSIVIANETDNQHKSVSQLIRTYLKELESMGKIEIRHFKSLKSTQAKRGRSTKVYQLNEMQATFLITLLDNNDKVVQFKLRLVQEFYRMRSFLLQKQTKDWQTARQLGKLTRRSETDAIKEFIEYAKAQGSINADKYYMNFSKLANRIAGVSGRDLANARQLNNLDLVENILLNCIKEGIAKNLTYKKTYQFCKDRLENVARLAYISA